MAVMRTRKDGGCSICYAAEENVGKRRCCHILDNAAIEVRHEKGMNFIDITGKVADKDTELSIKASTTKVKNFISNLSKGLDKKTQQNILSALRDEK